MDLRSSDSLQAWFWKMKNHHGQVVLKTLTPTEVTFHEKRAQEIQFAPPLQVIRFRLPLAIGYL